MNRFIDSNNMPQVSRKKLDKDIKKEMFNQFWKSLGKIKSTSEAAQFFTDLLTDTEKVMLAKRFTIATLLVRGRTPVEIKDTINVTFSTIGSVGSWLKNAKPKTKEILEKLSREKDWEAFGDKIDEFLDKLPPNPRSDWKKIYKERRLQAHKRSAKRALR